MSKRKGAKRRRLAAARRSPGVLKTGEQRRVFAEAEMPYHAGSTVLVLGDGDFSWSRALARLRGAAGDGGAGLIVTAFDSMEDARRKYGDACAANADELQRSGARVLYGVDATAVDSCASLCEWRSACRFVVFNFPHAGAGIKDERQNAEHHRRLIRRTLRAARAMLAPRTSTAGAGEAHVTLRRGRPYSQWGVPSLADGLLGLRFAREVPFDPALYPGYEHRRTRGLAASRPDAAESWQPNSAVAKGEGSVTYCFERREQAEHEQRAERLSPGGGGGGGTV